MTQDHAKAKECADKAIGDTFTDGWAGVLNLSRCYLDLLERCGELEKEAKKMVYAFDFLLRHGENHYDDCDSLLGDEDEGYKCNCGGESDYKNALNAMNDYREALKTSKMGSEGI